MVSATIGTAAPISLSTTRGGIDIRSFEMALTNFVAEATLYRPSAPTFRAAIYQHCHREIPIGRQA